MAKNELETKSDKKNIRILVIAGVGLLSLFIIIRLVVRSQNDGQLTEIKGLDYKEVKLPDEKTKEERWEEEESKKFNEEMSGEKYVGSNFKDILAQTGKEKAPIVEEKQIEQQPLFNKQEKNNKQEVYTNPSDNEAKNFDAVIHQLSKNKKQPVQNNNTEQEAEVKQVNVPKASNSGGDEMFGTNKKGSSVAVSNKKSGSNYKAQVYGKHSIADGGGVIIRLMEGMTVDGVNLPKNTLLYGKSSYSGNRVKMVLNKAKTPGGEVTVRIKVYDNDRIEGIAYKAPIDEVVEKQQDETDINVGTKYDGIINKGVKSVVKGTKDLIQKTRTLKLDDGYTVFLEEIENNY